MPMSRLNLAAAFVAGLAGVAAMSQQSDSWADSQSAMVEQGKEIVFDRDRGNCLACHVIADGDLPGNLGPPLVAMKQRFPDKAELRERIYDSTAFNPNSTMPPFGRHGVLSDEEIDKITAYIHTL